jgi:hypothetical protein
MQLPLTECHVGADNEDMNPANGLGQVSMSNVPL